MAVRPASPPLSSLDARSVTTTDLWKLLGLVFVLVDHYGFFFVEDQTWWRLFGRIAAPIFFFLIGFARTRSVPWTWLAFGTVLTLMGYVTFGGLSQLTLNILLNFALLRLVVLPAVERRVMASPWRMALLAGACIPLIPASDAVLEYGTEGWLWAFFGLAHRRALESGQPRTVWIRAGLAVTAGAAYLVREIHDYGFNIVQSAILAGIVVALVIGLSRFRRETLDWAPPRPLALLAQLCGRFSLEIYAISLFAMEVLAYAIAD